MSDPKRVILCSDGDSTSIDSWSNIPYLLGVELERRGLQLIRVNLEAPWLLRRLWRYTLGPRHKLRHWHTSYDFFRSRTNHWYTTFRLNQAVRRHGGPDCVLLNLSISAAPTRSSIPVGLISDWSYHHYITDRLGRSPDRSEQGTITREHAAMERATLVGLLFPESAARLQRQVPGARVRFLGHVINGHPLAPSRPTHSPAEALLRDPARPWRLLFVGRPRYRDGLQLLLEALALLPPELDLRLDVIGIRADDVSSWPGLMSRVRCHGYLSKADSEQRSLYYSLLNDADLIINASSRWGGFSATVEAMDRRTAVLTPPYGEFTHLFGQHLTFGAYLHEHTSHALAAAIAEQFRDVTLLQQRQEAAQHAVGHMTWSAFVDSLLANLSCPTAPAEA